MIAMPLILIVPIGVLTFLYGYVGWRLLVPLNLIQPWKTLGWAIVVLAALFPLAAIAFRVLNVEARFYDLVTTIAYFSLGFASILFFFILLKDIILLFSFMGGKLYSFLQPETVETATTTMLEQVGNSRRQMLLTSSNFAILGVTGLLTGCGMVMARFQMETKKISIPLERLSTEFEGFRIVQISDIHVGPTIKAAFVKEIVERVNALKPDMIVLTGDLVDGSVDYLTDDVSPFSQLKAPAGKFFVTGNHEYYSGALQWLKKVKELGIDPLVNEHRVITRNSARLVLGGVTDIRAGQSIPGHKSDPEASLIGAPEADARILLAHQPISVYEASKAGYDLQLSGHTHGGQYFPYSSLIRIFQPFVAGLYQYEKTWLYVNRGAGHWGPPIRLGAPAEITEITLTRKDVSA
jgi:uncharacterized protein